MNVFVSNRTNMYELNIYCNSYNVNVVVQRECREFLKQRFLLEIPFFFSKCREFRNGV